MLLRFTVENYRCFREPATLSMVATTDERHPSHILEAPQKPSRILRAAGIYGANGHGKTKFIEAMAFVREVAVGKKKGQKLDVGPFKLDPSLAGLPSRFSVEFSVNGQLYEYGLAANKDGITEEWLYSTPKTKEVMLYKRRNVKTLEGETRAELEFGATLRKMVKSQAHSAGMDYLDFVAIGLKANQTFLSEAAERNVDALAPVHRWFSKTLKVVGANSEYTTLQTRAKEEKAFLDFISNYTKRADLGIVGLESSEIPFDFSEVPGLPKEAEDKMLEECADGSTLLISNGDGAAFAISKNENEELVSTTLLANHRATDGKLVRFHLSDESSGTIRLLHLLPMLADAAQDQCIYFIDEFDRKLHPILSYNFLQAFLNGASLGQIIFTTHNTHLLDLDLLRRDEIWFVQKRDDGSADIYSLADLKMRPDLDIEKGYFNGRFGAIPVIGDVASLGWLKMASGTSEPAGE